ncbi:MAG: short chain dehydrogenase, partial [Microbacterium sp.]|nr:short chain dehydrogenase [Microbacterium sp.]
MEIRSPSQIGWDGRFAVVTGTTDGIGRVIAMRLAAAFGAAVVLPARAPAKAEAALDGIGRAVPGADVTTHPLDLASLDPVAAFTRDLVADGRPVNLLVDNAGVMTPGSHGDEFYGPRRVVAGAPRRQDFWAPFRDLTDGPRLWDASIEMIGERFT